MSEEVQKKESTRKGYWIKILPSGEKRLCFKTKDNGKFRTVELSKEDTDRLLG